MKYRKKPVEIEAFQWGVRNEPHKYVPAWLGEAALNGHVRVKADKTLEIETLVGILTASLGDWIVRGVRGELYPVKPDIFKETYEAVDG